MKKVFKKNRMQMSHWVLLSALVIVIIFLVWASKAELEIVSMARGQVIASARTQIIQSANDGVISSLLVREGEKVIKGQLLVSLERSQALASQNDALGKVAALNAALVRLHAEVFGGPLVFSATVKKYPHFVKNQTELFNRRQQALKMEIEALENILKLAREELELNKPLLASGDIGKTEVIRLERSVAELNGQISSRRNKYFQDAQTEMTKVEEDLGTQMQSLSERTTTVERTEILSPANGIVKKIQITTPGAKVRPGDVVMELLPTDSTLIIEAKLKPADLAFIKKGQSAAIKLDAYDYSIYGSLKGTVSYISPDSISEDSRQGEQIYYRVHVEINDSDIKDRNIKHPGKKIEIQPGMTGSVEIKTGKKTVLKYLTKPLNKTLTESLRER